MVMESGSSTSFQPPVSPSSSSSAQTRFSQTPPDSPKSCMKGSRRLNFTESEGGIASSSTSTESTTFSWKPQPESSSISSSPKSPRKSAKTVMIKSPGSGSTTTPTGIIGSSSIEDDGSLKDEISASNMSTSTAELQFPTFQLHLSQHYETSPVLPNCTSNGSYEEYIRQKEEEERIINQTDSNCENLSFTFDTTRRDTNQYDPQLVEIATKFVNEIIEKAKLEVVNRQKAEGKQRSFSTTLVDRGRDLLRLGNGTTSNWYRRAHGTVSKWVTNICVRAQNAVKT